MAGAGDDLEVCTRQQPAEDPAVDDMHDGIFGAEQHQSFAWISGSSGSDTQVLAATSWYR